KVSERAARVCPAGLFAAIGMTYLLVFTVFVQRHRQSSNRRGETKDLTIYFQHAVYDRMPNAQKKEEMCHAVSRPGKHLRPSWRYGCNDLAPPTECYFYRRHRT